MVGGILRTKLAKKNKKKIIFTFFHAKRRSSRLNTGYVTAKSANIFIIEHFLILVVFSED